MNAPLKSTTQHIRLVASRLAFAAGAVVLVISCKLLTIETNPPMKTPLTVSLSGVASYLFVGDTMTVTPTVTDYTGDVTYTFSLNGTAEATTSSSNPAWKFGSNLSAGSYRIDVTGLSANGKSAGSASALFTVTGTLATVHLSWNPSNSTSVAGYKIHYGRSSGSYTSVVDTGNATSATVGGFIPGRTYYFVMTAYSETGVESGYSNEVAYTVPFP